MQFLTTTPILPPPPSCVMPPIFATNDTPHHSITSLQNMPHSFLSKAMYILIIYFWQPFCLIISQKTISINRKIR